MPGRKCKIAPNWPHWDTATKIIPKRFTHLALQNSHQNVLAMVDDTSKSNHRWSITSKFLQRLRRCDRHNFLANAQQTVKAASHWTWRGLSTNKSPPDAASPTHRQQQQQQRQRQLSLASKKFEILKLDEAAPTLVLTFRCQKWSRKQRPSTNERCGYLAGYIVERSV